MDSWQHCKITNMFCVIFFYSWQLILILFGLNLNVLGDVDWLLLVALNAVPMVRRMRMCRDAVVVGGLFLGLIKYSYVIDGMEELGWHSIVLWVAGG